MICLEQFCDNRWKFLSLRLQYHLDAFGLDVAINSVMFPSPTTYQKYNLFISWHNHKQGNC